MEHFGGSDQIQLDVALGGGVTRTNLMEHLIMQIINACVQIHSLGSAANVAWRPANGGGSDQCQCDGVLGCRGQPRDCDELRVQGGKAGGGPFSRAGARGSVCLCVHN